MSLIDIFQSVRITLLNINNKYTKQIKILLNNHFNLKI